MMHGGNIYEEPIEYDFSVNLNPMETVEITAQILKACEGQLGHYPDPKQRAFRKAVAAVEGVKENQLWGGNGASELLMALGTMLQPRRVMLLQPSFAGYTHVLQRLQGCSVIAYPLQQENDFLLGSSFLLTLEQEAKNGLEVLLLTNPNNPTGKNIPKAILLQTLEICKRYGTKLIVDECFIRLSDQGYSMASHIQEYSGLYVINAYTKLFAIPGIRVGYVLSDERNIEQIQTFLPEWNLSVIAEKAGVICSRHLCHNQWEETAQELIQKERAYLSSQLKRLGFTVWESETVFLLLYSREELFEDLKRKGILIRDCSDFEGLGKGYYRIAVKKHKENEVLIRTLSMRK